MGSFPTFLNPWYAAVAAAATIPPLILLYFLKLRRREMPVSSTILWKKAIVDLQVNAPFQKLRRNLLLILQLLLLIFLLLALARPIISYAKGAGRSTVILIDRSASMGAKDGLDGKGTRLDEAKARAKSLIDTLDRTSQAMVIAFDDSAETVQPFTADTIALKNAIDAIKQTDRKSRLKLAYQLAEAQTNFNPDQLRSIGPRPDVRLYSDGRVLDPSDLSIHADVTYEKIGSDKSANIGIVALSARRNYEHPTEVQVFARLANFGPDPTTADVQLTVDGSIQPHIGTVSLLPERWDDQQRKDAEAQGQIPRDGVEFTLDLTTSAVVRVEQMNKNGDVLAADDAAQVVVPPPKDLSVLLVTTGADPFMRHVFESLSLQKFTEMTPEQYEEKKPADFDVIVFDAVKPTFLPQAGNFVEVGVVPDNLKIKAVQINGRPQVNPEVVGVLDWKRDHPIFRDVLMQKVASANVLKLEVAPEDEILADSTYGPLVVLHREGRQTHLVIAFDMLDSTWPTPYAGKAFPLFWYNAMKFLAVGSDLDVRQSVEPGATPRIPRQIIDHLAPGARTIKLIDPTGKSRDLPIPASGDFALPSLDYVGVYKTDPPLPPFDQIAVNLLDPVESDVLPNPKPPGGIGEATTAGPVKARLELWWWLTACAALPLLMIEWWVYTRRVHM